MKIRSRISVLIIALTYIFLSGAVVSTAQEVVPYDLTGDWIASGQEVLKPFCGGSKTKEPFEVEMSIVQSGDEITMIFPDDPDDTMLFGRTSNHFIAAEGSDQDQLSIFSGNVREGANTIVGHLFFLDQRDCPETGTGKTKLMFNRN